MTVTKRNTPSTRKEPGMALSRTQFMVRCTKESSRAKCERLWATRHGDGPS